jgi:hypothetical protein
MPLTPKRRRLISGARGEGEANIAPSPSRAHGARPAPRDGQTSTPTNSSDDGGASDAEVNERNETTTVSQESETLDIGCLKRRPHREILLKAFEEAPDGKLDMIQIHDFFLVQQEFWKAHGFRGPAQTVRAAIVEGLSSKQKMNPILKARNKTEADLELCNVRLDEITGLPRYSPKRDSQWLLGDYELTELGKQVLQNMESLALFYSKNNRPAP